LNIQHFLSIGWMHLSSVKREEVSVDTGE